MSAVFPDVPGSAMQDATMTRLAVIICNEKDDGLIAHLSPVDLQLTLSCNFKGGMVNVRLDLVPNAENRRKEHVQHAETCNRLELLVSGVNQTREKRSLP